MSKESQNRDHSFRIGSNRLLKISVPSSVVFRLRPSPAKTDGGKVRAMHASITCIPCVGITHSNVMFLCSSFRVHRHVHTMGDVIRRIVHLLGQLSQHMRSHQSVLAISMWTRGHLGPSMSAVLAETAYMAHFATALVGPNHPSVRCQYNQDAVMSAPSLTIR